ncbi:MAG: hypothetical protein JO256_07485 [Alphaproteobacteria bacterium]|nr:hypothetical protein [Alphaproteobacteria bacterium]
MKKLAAFALLFLGGTAAFAQPMREPETVYSEAQRSKDLLDSRRVVELMLAPSFSIENQYARWKHPVCPHVYGLTPVNAWFVEHRIKQVAAMVGAPVDMADKCIADIGVIFTREPQASLLSIASARPFLVQGGSQKLVVKSPVQAWYAAFKVDYDGFKTIDIDWDITEPWRGEGDYPQVASNDSKLHSGQHAELGAATVLVDTAAVTGMSLGAISDYVALLTLSQASQYGACQPMPTIANLMVKGCDPEDTPHALSHIDIALLTALYQVPDNPELLQKQRIVGAMRRSLEAQFGK